VVSSNAVAMSNRVLRALAATVVLALAGAASADSPGTPEKPAAPAAAPTVGCPVTPKDARPLVRKPGVKVPAPAVTANAGLGPTCRPPPAASRACMKKQPLCPRDLEIAKIAWKYFENNYQPKTGLVNSADGYPSTSIWDAASTLGATLAAFELGLITDKQLDERVTGLMGALSAQKLFEGKAPNKAYSSVTNEMTDYNNNPTEGIGYSALDLARMVSMVNVLTCFQPRYADTAAALLQRWNYCDLSKSGQMYGVYVDPATKKPVLAQEGRLGYEQYGGKALARVGFDQHVSSTYDNGFAATVDIYEVPIRYDKRDSKTLGAYNYVVTESYALDAMEFGLDEQNRPLLRNIFEVQKRRWQRTGRVTAVSEDNVDRDPWFIYNTIFVEGTPWKAITDTGYDQEALKTVSVKAAFSLAALFPEDPYSDVLMEKIANAYDPNKGWYSGVYENGTGYNRSLTANTNGIILEALAYRMYGPLHQLCRSCGRGLRWDPEVVQSKYGQEHCLPGAPAPTPKTASR